ncbi:MAG: tail fiber domain-containing protein, partial [Bacteroidota bacterium]
AVESEIPYGGKFTVNDISYPATFALEGNVPTPSSGSGYSASGVRGLIGNYFFGYAVYGNAAVGDKRYAGYFVGDVVYTGSISKISDQRLKKNIRNVTSALEIVSQLRPTHYEYKYDAYPNVNLSQEPEYGFIAQEVEKVLPDLVNPIANPIYDNEDPANFKVEEYIGLDYVQFIPILTAAIQELQQEVATLKSQLADTKEYQGDAIGLNIPGEKAILFQNEPNPFAESTTIRYQLPDQFERATLYIFDMQGKQVKAYEGLNERGEVEILGSSLDAGMYLYSLIVDGQEMDTKRMILTK